MINGSSELKGAAAATMKTRSIRFFNQKVIGSPSPIPSDRRVQSIYIPSSSNSGTPGQPIAQYLLPVQQSKSKANSYYFPSLPINKQGDHHPFEAIASRPANLMMVMGTHSKKKSSKVASASQQNLQVGNGLNASASNAWSSQSTMMQSASCYLSKQSESASPDHNSKGLRRNNLNRSGKSEQNINRTGSSTSIRPQKKELGQIELKKGHIKSCYEGSASKWLKPPSTAESLGFKTPMGNGTNNKYNQEIMQSTKLDFVLKSKSQQQQGVSETKLHSSDAHSVSNQKTTNPFESFHLRTLISLSSQKKISDRLLPHSQQFQNEELTQLNSKPSQTPLKQNSGNLTRQAESTRRLRGISTQSTTSQSQISPSTSQMFFRVEHEAKNSEKSHKNGVVHLPHSNSKQEQFVPTTTETAAAAQQWMRGPTCSSQNQQLSMHQQQQQQQQQQQPLQQQFLKLNLPEKANLDFDFTTPMHRQPQSRQIELDSELQQSIQQQCQNSGNNSKSSSLTTPQLIKLRFVRKSGLRNLSAGRVNSQSSERSRAITFENDSVSATSIAAPLNAQQSANANGQGNVNINIREHLERVHSSTEIKSGLAASKQIQNNLAQLLRNYHQNPMEIDKKQQQREVKSGSSSISRNIIGNNNTNNKSISSQQENNQSIQQNHHIQNSNNSQSDNSFAIFKSIFQQKISKSQQEPISANAAGTVTAFDEGVVAQKEQQLPESQQEQDVQLTANKKTRYQLRPTRVSEKKRCLSSAGSASRSSARQSRSSGRIPTESNLQPQVTNYSCEKPSNELELDKQERIQNNLDIISKPFEISELIETIPKQQCLFGLKHDDGAPPPAGEVSDSMSELMRDLEELDDRQHFSLLHSTKTNPQQGVGSLIQQQQQFQSKVQQQQTGQNSSQRKNLQQFFQQKQQKKLQQGAASIATVSQINGVSVKRNAFDQRMQSIVEGKFERIRQSIEKSSQEQIRQQTQNMLLSIDTDSNAFTNVLADVSQILSNRTGENRHQNSNKSRIDKVKQHSRLPSDVFVNSGNATSFLSDFQEHGAFFQQVDFQENTSLDMTKLLLLNDESSHSILIKSKEVEFVDQAQKPKHLFPEQQQHEIGERKLQVKQERVNQVPARTSIERISSAISRSISSIECNSDRINSGRKNIIGSSSSIVRQVGSNAGLIAMQETIQSTNSEELIGCQPSNISKHNELQKQPTQQSIESSRSSQKMNVQQQQISQQRLPPTARPSSNGMGSSDQLKRGMKVIEKNPNFPVDFFPSSSRISSKKSSVHSQAIQEELYQPGQPTRTAEAIH